VHLTSYTQKIQSFDWPKWCCMLWRNVNSRLLLGIRHNFKFLSIRQFPPIPIPVHSVSCERCSNSWPSIWCFWNASLYCSRPTKVTHAQTSSTLHCLGSAVTGIEGFVFPAGIGESAQTGSPFSNAPANTM